MLQIKPIQDKEQQKKLVTDCNGVYNADEFAYIAAECSDDGETVHYIIGACQFAMKNDRGSISLLRCLPGVQDDEALIIMGRAAASFLFRCGIRYLTISCDGADEYLIKALGFTPNADGAYELDIYKYYSTPCHDR